MAAVVAVAAVVAAQAVAVDVCSAAFKLRSAVVTLAAFGNLLIREYIDLQ